MQTAADGDRAAAGDAFEPVGAAGKCEVAIASHQVDAFACHVAVGPRAILGGDGATPLGFLLSGGEIDIEDRRAHHEAGIERPLLRLDKHHTGEGADERSAVRASLEDLTAARPGGKGFHRLLRFGESGQRGQHGHQEAKAGGADAQL